jgi:hypothetical protein
MFGGLRLLAKLAHFGHPASYEALVSESVRHTAGSKAAGRSPRYLGAAGQEKGGPLLPSSRGLPLGLMLDCSLPLWGYG